MANLKDIRNRIKSVKSIQKVTKAMKMVAVAKMRRAQERMEEARPYTKRLAEVINHLLPDVDRNFLPLLDIREIKRVGYVVVSSDRGLAGSFNTSVLKTQYQCFFTRIMGINQCVSAAYNHCVISGVGGNADNGREFCIGLRPRLGITCCISWTGTNSNSHYHRIDATGLHFLR